MMQDAQPKLIALLGPTASGKSSLAVQLAKEFNGEVVSVDSRQVYRQLDIGTAKITKEEMDGVPHHLLDLVPPQVTYTAEMFVRDGQAAVADIHARGKVPIVAGGTFFYLDALLGTRSMATTPPNPQLREALETHSTKALYKSLAETDPERAANIDPYNRRRLIRALEIVADQGSVPAVNNGPAAYNALHIGLTVDRDILRERYAARAKVWLDAGFMNEIDSLRARGITTDRLQELGFEYQLGLQLNHNEITRSEFIQRFVEKNWQYAKRQYTWLRRYPDIHWYTPDASFDDIKTLVTDFLHAEV